MKSNSKPSLALGSFSLTPGLGLIAILFVGFALRAARLDFQPLWWDEGYSLFFATRDLAMLLDRTALDIHPPLYYVFLKLWMLVAGKSDVAVRFMSVAIGTATIPLLYVFARRLLNQSVALLAAFLLAIAPMLIYYSQEVRMYGLVTILGIASVYCFIRLFNAPTRTLWIAYILITAAALYTQYYAAFILAAEITIVLAQAFGARSLRVALHYILAWLAIALLYLPWVIYAGNKLYNYVTFKVGHEAYPMQDPVTFLAQHLAAFSIGHISALFFLSWGTILFVFLSALGIYSLHRRIPVPPRPALSIRLRPSSIALAYFFIPLAFGYLVNLFYPFHPIRYERLLLLASPAFFFLVAVGINAIKRRMIAFSAICALAGLSALSLFDLYSVPRYPDDDYRSLVAQVQTLAQPRDNFLAIYPWQIGYLEAYYRGAPLNVIETPNDEWTNNPTRLRSDMDALLAKNPRVWIPALQSLGRIVEDALDANLRAINYSVLDTWFGTTRLELFEQAPDPPQAARPLRFDNGLTLARWGMSGNTVVSGQDIIRAWFDWGENTPTRLKLSLRLIDPKENVWVQEDRSTEAGVQHIGLAVPAGTPPGVYDLRLAIYSDDQPSTPAISLGTVTVEPNQNANLAAIPHRTSISFADGMALVGFEATTKPVRPGEATGITLFWQTAQKQNQDYAVAIQLQDAFNRTLLDAKDSIAFGIYDPTRWRANELVRDPRTFTVAGNVPDGTYYLAVSLIDPAAQARVKTNDGRDSVQLLNVQVKGRQHYFGVPTPSHKADFRFGDVARLVGYDSIRSGQNLRVVIYWQALSSPQISYKGFVHILDSNNQLITQRDQIPGAGEFPTTTWVQGEYMVDVYDITLPNGLADFQIQIGLYDPATNARLLVFDAAGKAVGDHLVLK